MKIHCKYDELLNPNKLKDHLKNRNKHAQDQIERLSELYKYQGIRHPIIISNLSKCIVAGHGRKLAAIRAGVKEFPVVYQDFNSEEQEYAFIQSDNAIALWAELDFSAINNDVIDFGSEFNPNNLAIKDFKLDDKIEMINKGDENSEWIGMPEFNEGEKYIKLIIQFISEDNRKQYCEKNNIKIERKMNNQWIAYL